MLIMNNKKQYIPRLFDDVLSFALKSKGAVVLNGVGSRLHMGMKKLDNEAIF